MTLKEYKKLTNRIENTLKHTSKNFSIKYDKTCSGFDIFYKKSILHIFIECEEIVFYINKAGKEENYNYLTLDTLDIKNFDYEIIEYIIDMYIKFLFDKKLLTVLSF